MTRVYIRGGPIRRLTLRVYGDGDADALRAVASYLAARHVDPSLPAFVPPTASGLISTPAAARPEIRRPDGPAPAEQVKATPNARPRPAILDMTREAELGAGIRQSDKGSTNR